MRNGIVFEVLAIMVILVIASGSVIAQKAYQEVTTGKCDKVYVPVVLDETCKPNVLLRDCNMSNQSVDVDCTFTLDQVDQ